MQCIILTVSKAVRYKINIDIQNDSFMMIIKIMSEPVNFLFEDVRVNLVEIEESCRWACV